MESDEPINYQDWITQEDLDSFINEFNPVGKNVDNVEAVDESEIYDWETLGMPSELPDHSAQDVTSNNKVQFRKIDNDFPQSEPLWEFKPFCTVDVGDDWYETVNAELEETTSVGSSTRPEKSLERTFEQLDMNNINDEYIECLR